MANKRPIIISQGLLGELASNDTLPLNILETLSSLRLVVTDVSGKLSVSVVTATEASYLSGVTSSIQDQLNNRQPLNIDLTSILGLSSTGILTRTSNGSWALRTITGTSGNITVTNGDGVSGNPNINLSNIGTAGTYAVVTTDAFGRVVSGNANQAWSTITGTPTSLSGYGITNAYTKTEVDTIITGMDNKTSVRLATTANITLSGLQTIDGGTTVANDRILVKNQSNAAQNGIYLASSGSWTRVSDADQDFEVTSGMYVYVEEGGQAGSGWNLTTANPIIIGTTALTFTQFNGLGQIIAGAGLTKTGNTLDINTASSARIIINTDNIDLATTGVSANTYKSVTVDAYGRVTAGTNPTTLSGYGITDAQPLDADLTAISALSGTSGFLKKISADTWTLDTTVALTTGSLAQFSSTTSSQLAGIISDKTGSGALVFGTSPTIITPIINRIATSQVSKIDSLYIAGSGLNNPSSAGIIKLGGASVLNTTNRGLSLAVINKSDHSVASVNVYDTHGSTSDSDSLASALNSITNQQVGILVSYDSWASSVTANLRNAFLRLGLLKAYGISESRVPYAAIFEGSSSSTVKSAKSVEIVYSSNANQPVSLLSGWLIDGSFVTAQSSGLNALFLPNSADTALVVNESGNIGLGINGANNFKLEVGGHVGPSGDNTYDLGSSSLRWRNLYLSGGIYQSSSSPLNIELVRAIPTNINDFIEIGNFNLTYGAHSVRITITNSNSNFSNSKIYQIPISYNATANVWKIVPAESESDFNVNDYSLDINVNGSVAYFRIRRTSILDASGGVAKIRIESVGELIDSFTATTATGTAGTIAITDTYGVINTDWKARRLGINTINPAYTVDIRGINSNVGVGVVGGNTINNDTMFFGSGTTTGLNYLLDGSISASQGAVIRLLNQNNASTNSDASLILATGGIIGGSPKINFDIAGSNSWIIGVHNSDSRKFKIQPNSIFTSFSLLTLTTDNKLGINVNSPVTDLDVASAISRRYVGASSETRHYTYVHSYVESEALPTGTFRLKLPSTKRWSNTMLWIRIIGYDYSSSGAWEVIVSGYNYQDSVWVNCSAEIRGNAPFSSIRLADDGANNLILLGNTSSTWSYPRITVDTLIASYANIDGWHLGWSSGFITSETGIVSITSPSIRQVAYTTGGSSNAFVNNGNSFGTTAILGTNDNNVLAFRTNNTERARIGTDGLFAIGSTIARSNLDITVSGIDSILNGLQFKIPESTVGSARIGLITDTPRQQSYIRFNKLLANTVRASSISFHVGGVNSDSGTEALTIDGSASQVLIGYTTAATAGVTSQDSYGLVFRGSVWNGTTAVERNFSLFNDAFSPTNNSLRVVDPSGNTISEFRGGGDATFKVISSTVDLSQPIAALIKNSGHTGRFLDGIDTAAGVRVFTISANAELALGTALPSARIHTVSSGSINETRMETYHNSASPNLLSFYRYRGTSASELPLQVNDILGEIAFYGRGLGAIYKVAKLDFIATNIATAYTDGLFRIRTASSEDGIERDRLILRSTDGNVSFGGNSITSSVKFEVIGDNYNNINLFKNPSVGSFVRIDGAANYDTAVQLYEAGNIYYNQYISPLNNRVVQEVIANKDFYFVVAGTGKYVFNSGNVGIGKVPTEKLNVTDGKILLESSSISLPHDYLYKAIQGINSRNDVISLMAGLRGRVANRNPYILEGTNGYYIYNNAGGSKVSYSVAGDVIAPNVSGQIIRVSYDGSGTPSTDPTPGFGGIYINSVPADGVNDAVNKLDAYKKGGRYFHKIWAKIPVGRSINWASNTYGNGGGYWLSSQEGTGAWHQYVFFQTIGDSGVFSSTGYLWISGGANSAFTWDLASWEMLGIDEAPSVSSTANLNIGYNLNTNLEFGQLMTGGNVGIKTAPHASTALKISGGNGSILLGQLPSYASYNALDLTGQGNTYTLLHNNGDDLLINAQLGRSIRFRINNSDQMILTSSGLLGLGTSSPSSRLHVEGDSLHSAFISTSGNGVLRLSDSFSGANRKELYFTLDTVNNYSIIQSIQQGISARPILINPSGGNVGIGIIGTSSPDATLTVAGQSVLTNESTPSIKFINNATSPPKVLQLGYDNSLDTAYIYSYHSGTAQKPVNIVASSLGVGSGALTSSAFRLQTAGHIGPSVNSIYNLGSESYKWNELFVNKVKADVFDWGTSYPVFGQRSYKINELNDLLWRASTRFTVTNGHESYFDGSFDSGGPILPYNSSTVITISLANQSGVPSYGVTYGQGDIYVSFYYTNINYNSISLRYRYNLYTTPVWSGAVSGTNISTNSNFKVIKFEVGEVNYLGDIELTVVTGSSDVQICSINYFLTRHTVDSEVPYISKYIDSNTLYGQLKFKTTSNTVNHLINAQGDSYLNLLTGNLGVGIVASSNKFSINQPSDTTVGDYNTYGFGFFNQGALNLTLGADGGNVYLQSFSSKPLVINALGNNVAIPASKLGIGTISNISKPLTIFNSTAPIIRLASTNYAYELGDLNDTGTFTIKRNDGLNKDRFAILTQGGIKENGYGAWNYRYRNILDASYDGVATGAIIINSPIQRNSDTMFRIRVHGYLHSNFLGNRRHVDFSFWGYSYSGINGPDSQPGSLIALSFQDYGNDGHNKYIGVNSSGKIAVALGDPDYNNYISKLSVDCDIVHSTLDVSSGWSWNMSSAANYDWLFSKNYYGTYNYTIFNRLSLGTTASNAVLTVSGTTAPDISLISTSDPNYTVKLMSKYDSTNNFGIYGGDSSASSQIIGANLACDRVFIPRTGSYLGVGVSTPLSTLHLGNNVNDGFSTFGSYQMLLFTTGVATSSYGIGVEPGNLNFNSATAYKFYTSNNFVLGINSDGGLNIANGSAVNILNIQSTPVISRPGLSSILRYGHAGNSYWQQHQFYTNDTEVTRIHNNGLTIFSPVVDAHSSTPALDVNGAWMRIGDGLTSQTYTNGIGIKFHDSGVSHASIKWVSTANRLDFGRSSSVGHVGIDSGFECLSLDLASKRAGINNTSPGTTLHVGTGAVLAVPDAGGTSRVPDMFAVNSSGYAMVGVGVSDGTNNRRAALFVDQANSAWGLGFNWSSGESPFVIRSGGAERLRIDTSGRVGIGNNNPQHTLHTNGAIYADADVNNVSYYIPSGSSIRGTGSSQTHYLDLGRTYLRGSEGSATNGLLNVSGGINVGSSLDGLLPTNGVLRVADYIRLKGSNGLRYLSVLNASVPTVTAGSIIINSPISRTSDIMFSIRVHGFSYSTAKVIDFTFVGYCYAAGTGPDSQSGALYNISFQDNGNDPYYKYIGINSSGNLAISLDCGSGTYIHQMIVDCQVGYVASDVGSGWTMTESSATNFGWVHAKEYYGSWRGGYLKNLVVVGDGGVNNDLVVNGRIRTGDGSQTGGVWLNSDYTMFIGNNNNQLGFFNGSQWTGNFSQSGNFSIGNFTADTAIEIRRANAALFGDVSAGSWNNSVTPHHALTITNSQASTGAGAFDSTILFRQTNSASNRLTSAAINVTAQDVWSGTTSTQVSKMQLLIRNSSGTLIEGLALFASGNVTIAGSLFVGGNQVSTGTGTTNRLVKWGSSTTTTNSNLTDDGISVGVFQTSPTSKLHVSGSVGFSGVTTSSNLTLNNTHHRVYVDSTSSPITITLPSAVGITDREYLIKDWKGKSGTNAITIVTTSGQTIDGATSVVLTNNYDKLQVASDGANWVIIG